jgi:hypothetical protein
LRSEYALQERRTRNHRHTQRCAASTTTSSPRSFTASLGIAVERQLNEMKPVLLATNLTRQLNHPHE